MKKIYFLPLLLMASCSDKIDDATNHLGDESLVSYSISVDATSEVATTKVEVTPDAEKWTVAWSEDDSVIAWHKNAEGQSQLNKFVVSEIADDVATLSGDAYENYNDIRFIYPYNENLSVADNGTITLDLSKQSIDLRHPHTTYGESGMYMIGDSFSPSASNTSISMRHLLTALELNFTPQNFNSTASLKEVTIVGLPSEGELSFDYDHSALSGFATTAHEAITIEIKAGALTNDELVTIPFATMPFETTEGMEVSFTLTFNDNTFYTAKAKYAGVSDYPRAECNDFTPESYIFDGGDLSINTTLSALGKLEEAPAAQKWYVSNTSANATTVGDLQSAISLANLAGYNPKVVFTALGDLGNSIFGSDAEAFDGACSIEIDDTCTSFGTNAFRGWSGLTSFEAKGATQFGNTPFTDCVNLQTLKLPALTSFVNNFIQNVSTLENIYIGVDGEGVTSVGSSNPFSAATNLDKANLYVKIGNADLFIVETRVRFSTRETPTSNLKRVTFKNIITYEADGTYKVYNSTYDAGQSVASYNDIANYLVE